MDTSASDIRFDKDGVCSYCTDFLSRSGHLLQEDPAEREKRLDVLVGNVKGRGKGNPYDCVVGVSGGVDSSWALVQAVNLGLRPLAVHMDNGWNSELAQNNIANLVRGLGLDLHTHVIDWTEYRRLMQAFFDADVIDVELLYDNAMLAVNFQQAARYKVSYILAGSNTASEGMILPKAWHWHKYDRKNIRNIAKRFGRIRIDTYPSIGTFGRLWHEVVRKRQWISFLDYFEYNKFEAMEVLQRDYGYKPYPYKHYESVFTRFYQGFILPQKFRVDKRRVHLSTLIVAGQMTREEALKTFESIPYPSEKKQEEDRIYFLKKMGWSSKDLKDYLNRPEIPHDSYGSERKLYEGLVGIYKCFTLRNLKKSR
jgi:N-acetyl sugar amidotransferase